MKLKIPKDYFDSPTPPRLFLCTTSKKKIGELKAYDISLDAKWGAYSELSFSIDRQYTDLLTGETKVDPLFDKAEGLRMVYAENMGYFIIQDPDANYSDKDSKTLSCFSSEYTCGTKYLENFYVNTGEVDSKEVMYLAQEYGEGYTVTQDDYYKLASGEYDSYEEYYIKDYTATDKYVYTQTTIADKNVYKTYFDSGSNAGTPLYVKKYPNVRFYWPTKDKLSLLHLIFEKIPEWTIGNVDVSLRTKERKFDEERISVYDFLMNEVQNTFKCVVEWDTINNEVNFYEEAEDGITEDNAVQTRWDTDIYVSRDNLASEINIQYSSDNIKTKLKVSGSDDLNVREVNLGQNYIMDLSYYHNSDWMSEGLFNAYDTYLSTCEEYKPQYAEAMQNWITANNSYNDLMNAVPVENNVVLIGDEFKKLYCVYTPYDTAYLSKTITDNDIDTLVEDNLYSLDDNDIAIDKNTLNDQTMFCVQGYRFVYNKKNKNFKCMGTMISHNEGVLTDKLKLYQVNKDIDANKTDNILLKLKNTKSDVATIRIYNAGTETKPSYMIQSIVVGASSGVSEAADESTISEWINGTLTAEKMDLKEYQVTYIGTMGAYFVLAKDETKEATLEEYGVNLLKIKHDTYIKIFQTQTEAMFSDEKYQCIAQNEEPVGDYDEGTRWLDTNSSPVVLKKYTKNKGWKEITGREGEVTPDDEENYGNYQRYIDNYDKMIAVQNVLVRKETDANYWLNGYPVTNIKINTTDGSSLSEKMKKIAMEHFGVKSDSITQISLDTQYPLYRFTTTKYPIIYASANGEFNPRTKYYIKKEEEGSKIDVYEQVDIKDEDGYKSYGEDLYIVKSGHIFAVYLRDTIPYVAYEDSQGVYQMIKDYITQKTTLNNFFTSEQWAELSPLIREDEYSDDNFLLTGYESEEERLSIYQELFDTTTKELKTLSRPSLEFSMNMANILAIPEFAHLKNQFQLGNFIRVHIRDDYIKRTRLLEAHLGFDDLSDFSCNFGNLVTTKSEIEKHADLMKQAVTAGKTVATAASDWQKAVDKSNRLEEAIAEGLADATLQIGKASGQSIELGQYGLRGRKLKDGSTDEYEDEQVALINNKLVFTSDNWKTSKSAFGKIIIEDENGDKVERWGVLVDAMVGVDIQGSTIRGGTLRIGNGDSNYFEVDENGNVKIYSAGQEKYATTGEVTVLQQALQYQIELIYEGSTIFSNINDTCILTCKVSKLNNETKKYENVTSKLEGYITFNWRRDPDPWLPSITPENDSTLKFNQIKITHEDVPKNAQFFCQVEFDDAILNI